MSRVKLPTYIDTYAPSPFLINLTKDDAVFAIQAATLTGLPVYLGDPSANASPGYVGVYTRTPRRNHSAFWCEFDRLREEAKREATE